MNFFILRSLGLFLHSGVCRLLAKSSAGTASESPAEPIPSPPMSLPASPEQIPYFKGLALSGCKGLKPNVWYLKLLVHTTRHLREAAGFHVDVKRLKDAIRSLPRPPFPCPPFPSPPLSSPPPLLKNM